MAFWRRRGSIESHASLEDRAEEKPSKGQSDGETNNYLSSTKLYLILLGLGLAIFLMALDVAIIATAIPSITARFHSTTDIGWYGATYPLCLCSLQPLAGKIYTLFSLKKTFLVFICIFMLGSVLCGAASSSIMFIIGRSVAGAGAAGIYSGGLSILAVVAPLSKRALYIALLSSLFGVATVIGPLIGGVLTTKATWRWCFFINPPIGVVTVSSMVLFFKPPRRETDGRLSLREKILELDIIGCGLFIPSIIMILLALQWGGNQHAWKSATIIGLFCGFGGLITVFLSWEYHKGDKAMIPFSILFNRSIFFTCLFGCLFMCAYILGVYYLPEWFQVIKGATPLHSGVMQLASVIAQVLSSIVSGMIINRTGWYNPWAFIGPVFISIAVGLYTTLTPSTSHQKWIAYQVLQGIGGGVTIQVSLLSVQAVLAPTPRLVPIGISLVAFFQYFGTSVSQSIALAVFQNQLITSLKRDAGLDEAQVKSILSAGATRVRQVTRDGFPEKTSAVISAYNKAIASIFYVAVAAAILSFFVAMGIKWKNMKAKPSIPPGDEASVALPVLAEGNADPISQSKVLVDEADKEPASTKELSAH